MFLFRTSVEAGVSVGINCVRLIPDVEGFVYPYPNLCWMPVAAFFLERVRDLHCIGCVRTVMWLLELLSAKAFEGRLG